MGFSDEEQYRDGFGPFTPGFKVLPYGDLAAIEKAIGPNTAAILVEPIQGESGIHVPPAGYLKGIEALCRKHRVLFVADEIQSGLGRTGKLFAFQHEDVHPDVVIVGKALGGGFYPISGILANDDVMSVFHPGDHGSTFGGNPLACAVAREALRVLVDENLIDNSATLGEYFIEKLRAIRSRHIREVRGRGLWIGIELVPGAGGARRSAKPSSRRGSCARRRTSTPFASLPPWSSPARSWTGPSSGSPPCSASSTEPHGDQAREEVSMTQKYRQRGYRESEREEDRRPKPTPQLTPEEKAQQQAVRHAVPARGAGGGALPQLRAERRRLRRDRAGDDLPTATRPCIAAGRAGGSTPALAGSVAPTSPNGSPRVRRTRARSTRRGSS